MNVVARPFNGLAAIVAELTANPIVIMAFVVVA